MKSLHRMMLALLVVVPRLALSETRGKREAIVNKLTRLQPRIIGGTEVRNRCTAPFDSMASLQFDSALGIVSFCSAAIITNEYLLTTGICASQLSLLGDTYAVLGERDLLMKDDTEQKISIDSYKIHPGYNASSLDNNIALIRLATPATFTSCVRSVIRMEEDPAACPDMDRSCIMVGWGPYVENTEPTNSRLPRYASVTVLGDLVTSLMSRYERGIESPVGCLYAEAMNPNIKACFFDWGGTVSCQRNGVYSFLGVISDYNCNADPTPPIAVTNVPFYRNWIDSCTNDWSRC